MTNRSMLPTTAVAAFVAVGAAIGTTTPATAAPPVERRADVRPWADTSADAAARSAAVRDAVAGPGGEGARTAADTFRIAGANRYATSVAGSKALYTDEILAAHPLDVVFVASGTNYPDALAATTFVVPFGPLLLVPPTGTVPSLVMNELRRLDPANIVLIGGENAVSEEIVTQLSTIATPGYVAGQDRYETAAIVAEIADEGFESQDGGTASGIGTMFVVNGTTFADALPAGAATGPLRGAIVLTKQGTLPAATAEAIRSTAPRRVVVLGGPGAVSESVVAKVRSLVPGKEVVRRSGADRFATAADLSQTEYVHPGRGVVLANGLDFPDALTASAFGALVEYPLLLSRSTCAPDATVDEVASFEELSYIEVVGFGGTTVLSDRALTLTRC